MAERAQGSIAELCIALAHRWVPGQWFVIFTSYFDEANTHGASPVITMGAFLGSARQWELMERRLKGIQADYGFSVFHAKEFKARSKQFRGWAPQKQANLIDDLTNLVRVGLTEGVVISLDRQRYLAEYRGTPFPKKIPVDSQFGLCFRACLSHMIGIIQRQRGKHVLNVVMESGHANAGCVPVIFEDARRKMERYGVKVLRSASVLSKGDCPPLMLADFLAHTFGMAEAMVRAGQAQSYADRVNEAPSGNDAGLTVLEFQPHTMQSLKAEFERDRNARMEEWRTAKAKKQSFSELAS